MQLGPRQQDQSSCSAATVKELDEGRPFLGALAPRELVLAIYILLEL